MHTPVGNFDPNFWLRLSCSSFLAQFYINCFELMNRLVFSVLKGKRKERFRALERDLLQADASESTKELDKEKR